MNYIKNFDEMFPNTQEISLVRDGVQTTYQKLLMKANNGFLPEGGLDFSAASGLGRCHDGAGDFHIEYNPLVIEEDDPSMYWFNFTPESVPPTMNVEPLPEESSKPFKFSEGERAAPGMLGKAIRAYGETTAVMVQYGQDTQGLSDWMQNEWSIPIEDMKVFNTHIPLVRSIGPAFWGGFGRKMKPFCFAYSAAQAKIKVKHHGTSRVAIAEDALVNWPRINAIARIIAGQLVADDRFCSDRIKKTQFRLDYLIFPYEIPRCPKKILIPKFKIQHANQPFVGMPEMVSNVMSYLSKNLTKERNAIALQTSGFINFRGSINLDTKNLRKQDYQARLAEPVFNFDYMISTMAGSEDIHGLAFKAKLPDKFVPSMTVHQILKQMARSYLFQNPGNWKRAREIREIVRDLEHGDQTSEVVDTIIRYIQRIYGVNCLHYISVVGNLIEKGLGLKWIHELTVGVEHESNLWSNPNKQVMFSVMLKYTRVVIKFLKALLDATFEYEHVHEPTFSDKAFKHMHSTHDISLCLNELFTPLKTKWTNRYLRNSYEFKKLYLSSKKEEDRENMVLNQLISKCFRTMSVEVYEEGICVPVRASICVELITSGKNFVKHRMNKTVTTFEHHGFNYDQILAGELDLAVENESKLILRPKYAHAAEQIMFRLSEFCADINAFVQDMLKHKIESELDFIENFEILQNVIQDDPAIHTVASNLNIVKELEVEPVLDNYNKPKMAVLPAMFDFFEDDEDDDNEELFNEKIEQLVDWVQELKDEYPGIKREHYQEKEAIYPKLIAIEMYEELKRDLKERWFRLKDDPNEVDDDQSEYGFDF